MGDGTVTPQVENWHRSEAMHSKSAARLAHDGRIHTPTGRGLMLKATGESSSQAGAANMHPLPPASVQPTPGIRTQERGIPSH